MNLLKYHGIELIKLHAALHSVQLVYWRSTSCSMAGRQPMAVTAKMRVPFSVVVKLTKSPLRSRYRKNLYQHWLRITASFSSATYPETFTWRDCRNCGYAKSGAMYRLQRVLSDYTKPRLSGDGVLKDVTELSVSRMNQKPETGTRGLDYFCGFEISGLYRNF